MIPKQLEPTVWQPGHIPQNNSRKGIPNRRSVFRLVANLVIETDKLPQEVIQRVKKVYPELPKTLTTEQMIAMTQAARAILTGDPYTADRFLNRVHGLPGQGDDDPYNEEDMPVEKPVDETEQLDMQKIEMYYDEYSKRYE